MRSKGEPIRFQRALRSTWLQVLSVCVLERDRGSSFTGSGGNYWAYVVLVGHGGASKFVRGISRYSKFQRRPGGNEMARSHCLSPCASPHLESFARKGAVGLETWDEEFEKIATTHLQNSHPICGSVSAELSDLSCIYYIRPHNLTLSLFAPYHNFLCPLFARRSVPDCAFTLYRHYLPSIPAYTPLPCRPPRPPPPHNPPPPPFSINVQLFVTFQHPPKPNLHPRQPLRRPG